jgi:hypothetical protein
MSLSLLLGKSHIALSPMNGLFVGFDTMDVNCISSGANTKTYSSIPIDFQHFVRPSKGPSYLFSVPLRNSHDLVIDVIGMWGSRFVFILTVLLNQILLTCMDIFPIHSILDIEYHVPSKDQLSWGFLQCVVWQVARIANAVAARISFQGLSSSR